MIKYVLYIFDSVTGKYIYNGTIEYQAKIIKGEKLRHNMKKYVVDFVDHDLDANFIDLYLKEETP